MSELAALLILAGALLAFGGALGLVRLRTFFERVHAPTMGTTLGTALILAGSIVEFVSLHWLLIAALMAITAPIGSTLLVAAARRRRRASQAVV